MHDLRARLLGSSVNAGCDVTGLFSQVQSGAGSSDLYCGVSRPVDYGAELCLRLSQST
jgi:hypothetical protein